MTFQLKDLTANDLSMVKQLIRLWIETDELQSTSIPNHQYLCDQLSDEKFHVIVALDKDKVIGGVTGYELKMFGRKSTEMFLYEIGVEQRYKRQGIARSLIEKLQSICRDRGIKEMFVVTSSDNEAAIQLYKKTGGEMEVAPIFTYSLDPSTVN